MNPIQAQNLFNYSLDTLLTLDNDSLSFISASFNSKQIRVIRKDTGLFLIKQDDNGRIVSESMVPLNIVEVSEHAAVSAPSTPTAADSVPSSSSALIDKL